MTSEEQRLTPKAFETYLNHEKDWFDNLGANLQTIRKEPGILELQNKCLESGDAPVVVVGAGPSVQTFNLLRRLKVYYAQSPKRIHVIAADKMLVPLLNLGIYPEIVASVDGSPLIAKFYQDVLHSRALVTHQITSAVLAVFVHPITVNSCPYNRYWFIPMVDNEADYSKPSVSRAIYHMTGGKLFGNGYGNAGAFGWSLAEFLGHKTVILLGIDFSYGANVQPSETMFWNQFLAQTGGDVKKCLATYYTRYDNKFGHKVTTDNLMWQYREVMQEGLKKKGIRTIQCGEYSILDQDVDCMSLEKALAET